MAKSWLTPVDVATRVNRSGMRVRKLLRQMYPRLAPGSGGRWLLTEEMVDAVLAYFAGESRPGPDATTGATGAPRHASDSAEQRIAETAMLRLLGSELGVVLTTQRLIGESGVAVEVDGLSQNPPILVEAFAHQGSLKVGQKHKVANDALKLAWAGRTLLPGARKILLFSDEAAAAPFRSKRSWAAAAIEDFGLEIRVVTLPEDVIASIRDAQIRQFR